MKMIDHLNLSKSAQFYRLNKPLSKSSITNAFKTISADRIGNYLINKVKQNHSTHLGNQVTYSIASYKIEDEPSFLCGSSIKEHKYAYLLLIECDDGLVVLKKHVDSINKFFSKFIDDFEYEKFCHFNGDKNPEYERVTMKNMSISDAVIRSRSLEAKSLNGIIPSNSSSRSVPSNFKMTIDEDSYTLTPNTSRVSHIDKKTSFDKLIDWAVSTKEEIKRTTNSSEFLNNFATPIYLDEIFCKGHKIVAILLDLSEIEEKIGDGLYTLQKSDSTEFTAEETKLFLNHLKSPLLVDDDQLKTKGVKLSGKLSYSEKVITIKSNIFNKIFVAENGISTFSIKTYINKNKPFSAVFDTPTYSYYSRSCFEDNHLLNNISSILNIFDDSYDFTTVKSEKEKPHSPTLDRFPDTSLFRLIEDYYDTSDNIVICDDMNDEWADHIIIDSKSPSPSISFIHSKFVNKDTYGASAFHEVVAQALKNIGRTQSETNLYETKYNSKWCLNYESTNIKRVTGAHDWTEVEQALNQVVKNPNAIKKVVLATPFLKKSKLQDELNKLAQGQQCKPHYVQLIWLINTFISSCKEFGVQAHILCKP